MRKRFENNKYYMNKWSLFLMIVLSMDYKVFFQICKKNALSGFG